MKSTTNGEEQVESQTCFSSLENSFLRVELSGNGTLVIKELKHGAEWKAESPFRFSYGDCYFHNLWEHCRHQITTDGNALHIHFDQYSWWAGFPGRAYYKPDPGPALEFDFSIELMDDEIHFTIGEIKGMDKESCTVEFPAGMLTRSVSEPGGMLIPCGYGSLYKFPRNDTFKIEYRYFYDYNTIPGYGWLFDRKAGIGVRIQDPCDQKIYFEVSTKQNCKASCGTIFEYNWRFANYPRRFIWKILPPGSSYNELAKWYRSTLIRDGKFVSLEEKIKRHPEVEKLVGTVCWKYNMYSQKELPPGIKRDYSYYIASSDVADSDLPNNRSAFEFFASAKAAGFDRVTVYNTGWNLKGYDKGYPTRLPPNPQRGTPEEFSAAADYARTLSDGFIYSVHDNYRDCYQDCPEEYRQNLQRTSEGGTRKGGIWRGGRAELLCPKQSMFYAKRDIPEIVKMVGRGSIYVDVFGCTNLEECWDPAHPQSRRDDLNARREILQYIADQFGSITTESAPTEALADIVTMGAFCSFFNSFSIPASAEMPIAVPFWQLVFHDSVLGTTCPMNNLKLEDYYPILALYGLLPLALDPESLKLSRELRSAYKAEMVRHQFLTPVKNSYQAVARTDFSDGTTVWANLTDQAYEADGISLPPHSFEIRTCEKSR